VKIEKPGEPSGDKARSAARAYRQSAREVQAGLTRLLLVQAACDLLAEQGDATAFSLDSVAQRAGVSRATVFNQFGGKQGLLHAVFDQLSATAGLMDVDAMLTQPDAQQALRDYVQAFADFYQSARALLRRLKAFAVMDPEFERLITAREEKRRAGLLWLVQRLKGVRPGGAAAASHARLAARLKALLVLEVFESLAGPGRSLREAAPEVLAMARALLDA
jgi:AcrR family transcriptional regulator